MKKAKNENAANKKTETAAKQEKSSVNDPSEKIRSKESEAMGLSFKKVLYGYDPNEVASYIKELTDNIEASARNYEMKLSSIKEELALSNRERDSYGEKYRECRAKLAKLPDTVTQNDNSENIAAEYEKIIDSLKVRLENAESENEKLRAMPVKTSADMSEDCTLKIAALEKENSEIKAKADMLERRNTELTAAERKYGNLLAEYNSLVSHSERMKAEIAEKSEEIGRISIENDESKKKLAGFEAENGVLQQCIKENEEEIMRLKESNKTQAHEYADKINILESERAAGRLAMQKEIKLRDYYINQAQTTLSELSEQMEHIRKTFTDTQSV